MMMLDKMRIESLVRSRLIGSTSLQLETCDVRADAAIIEISADDPWTYEYEGRNAEALSRRKELLAEILLTVAGDLERRLSVDEEIIINTSIRLKPSHEQPDGGKRYIASMRVRQLTSYGGNTWQQFERLDGRLARDIRTGSVIPHRAQGREDNQKSMLADNTARLSGHDFERVVQHLLEQLGLRVERTKGSWDGGIDCIAIDDRPIVGGKIIVQAKCYSGTVDAGAVRDLFGTMHSERASKGVLITTGRFGPTSWKFAEGKPIELIDGERLMALYSQIAARPDG